MLTTNELKEQLRKQLQLINNSCELFDRGHIDEAVRIAGAIRVLLHDTNRSTSLLTLMGSKSTISLRTPSAKKHDPASGMLFMDILAGSSLAPNKIEIFPVFKLPFVREEYLSANEWWNQAVSLHVPFYSFTRAELVLDAANKDGAAHVDKLRDRYAALSARYGLEIVRIREDNREHLPITDMHLLYLRQLGWEILNSPGLLALANA